MVAFIDPRVIDILIRETLNKKHKDNSLKDLNKKNSIKIINKYNNDKMDAVGKSWCLLGFDSKVYESDNQLTFPGIYYTHFLQIEFCDIETYQNSFLPWIHNRSFSTITSDTKYIFYTHMFSKTKFILSYTPTLNDADCINVTFKIICLIPLYDIFRLLDKQQLNIKQITVLQESTTSYQIFTINK